MFRLLPLGDVLRRPEDTSGTGDAPTEAEAEAIPVTAAETPVGSSEAVPLEVSQAGTFEMTPSTAVTAVKVEADLVERFRAVLVSQGSSPVRYRVRPPGEFHDLYTDLFDPATGTLYEAKGVATREAVRMALGQLLDYVRHVPKVQQMSVLLPPQPTADLMDLLASHGVRCTYEDQPGTFVTAIQASST